MTTLFYVLSLIGLCFFIGILCHSFNITKTLLVIAIAGLATGEIVTRFDTPTIIENVITVDEDVGSKTFHLITNENLTQQLTMSDNVTILPDKVIPTITHEHSSQVINIAQPRASP
jgi:hypothetical protein